MVGFGVVEGRAHVLPVIGQRRGDLLLAGDQHLGIGLDEVQEGPEVLDGEQLGDVRPIGGVLQRRDLGQLPMLLGQLGGRCHLHLLGLAEGALGERREPPERLDLVPEQVHPDRPVLGGREQIENAAPDCKLSAILDLIDPLVAGRHQIHGGLVQVEQLALDQREAVRSQRRVGDLLASARRR